MNTPEKINKTIVVSYDDTTRMKDFCCDDNGVTKDFMDWYVNENAYVINFTTDGLMKKGETIY